jgi:hypothetical protein
MYWQLRLPLYCEGKCKGGGKGGGGGQLGTGGSPPSTVGSTLGFVISPWLLVW